MKNKRVGIILLSILFIFALNTGFVSAQPPFQTFSGNTGITIEASVISVHKVNTDFLLDLSEHSTIVPGLTSVSRTS